MQIQLSTGLREYAIVMARARRWRLGSAETDDAAAVSATSTGDGRPRLLSLHSADTASSGTLRLLCPPDEIRVTPVPLRASGSRAWVRSLRTVHARGPDDDPPDTALRANVKPLAYQWVPLLALRSGRTRRLLLADEVGMGKTVQAGLVLAEIHDRMATARTLTVVPAGLVGQWRDELERGFALSLSVLDSGTLAARTADMGGLPAVPGDACLISLDMLRQPEIAALMERCDWELLVVDEAHQLAPGSARCDGVTRVARRASRLLLLTATPFTGAGRQDRHLLALGRRERASSVDRMLVVSRRSTTLGRAAVKQRVSWVVVRPDEVRLHAQLDAYVARALRDTVDGAVGRLAAFLLRRRACSSIAALQTSVQRRLDVLGTSAGDAFTQPVLPLEDEHDSVDDWLRAPAWSDMDAERACLDALEATARACGHAGAKPRWLVRWMGRCREPVLVFTEYADTLRALRPLLAPARRVACLYGAQTADQRQLAVSLFCSGEADVLLATDAAAEGLNLHHRCRLVVHVDVPWSPRRLTQRNGRLDRLGQTRTVRATVLAGRGTFDREVLARLAGRRKLADAAHAAAHADLATVASPRRERVAEESLRRCLKSVAARTGPRPDDALQALVTRRRWTRLALRLGLPARCQALVLARLGLAGVHPLVRSRAWVSAIARGAPSPDGVSAGVEASRDVDRFVRRARRRAARLEALAAAARASAPATPTADLFGSQPWTPEGQDPEEKPPARPALHVLALRVLSWRP